MNDNLLCEKISELVWASKINNITLSEWLDVHMDEYSCVEQLATRLGWKIKHWGFTRGNQYILWDVDAKVMEET
jgi:hypothetical protein